MSGKWRIEFLCGGKAINRKRQRFLYGWQHQARVCFCGPVTIQNAEDRVFSLNGRSDEVIITTETMASILTGRPNFEVHGKKAREVPGQHERQTPQQGLEMVTLDAINAKIAKLQKQAAAIARKQLSVDLTKIRDLMDKHELTVSDIEGFVAKRHGRKSAATQAKAAVRAPRASVRHVAPKYADPKTGATWSGRGQAPLGIRDVKDRSKFLIETGATAKDVGAKAAPAKKAAAKRVVAKRAAKSAVSTKKAGRAMAALVKGARGRKAAAPARRPRRRRAKLQPKGNRPQSRLMPRLKSQQRNG